MIWILLLYVLPFLICCIAGYYMSKKSGETVGDYLRGVLFCLIPLMNILFIILLIGKSIHDDKSIQDFLNRKL
jgi:hypothetical protein